MNWKASATDWMKSCSRMTVMGSGLGNGNRGTHGRGPRKTDDSKRDFTTPGEASPGRSSAFARAGERESRERDDREVDHAPVDLHRAPARRRIRIDHAPRPRELSLGRRERLVHDRHLARMDAELPAEAEAARARDVLAKLARIVG